VVQFQAFCILEMEVSGQLHAVAVLSLVSIAYKAGNGTV